MPSLNNMEMAAAVAANKNIEIKKTFFGLKTQVIYTPHGQPRGLLSQGIRSRRGEQPGKNAGQYGR